MDVLDRNLLEVGNRVVFAREVEIVSHCRKKTEGGASRVLVRPVRIGGYSFIGAQVQIGPGASVPANASVPERTIVDVNETFGEPARHHEPAEAEFALS
jgi:acetyltransferase-like isoleucine patch superfamily enzyme